MIILQSITTENNVILLLTVAQILNVYYIHVVYIVYLLRLM